ncbi:MAG: tyrosine-type recombinase/integrase [Candidatus Dormibacteria bacterium]
MKSRALQLIRPSRTALSDPRLDEMTEYVVSGQLAHRTRLAYAADLADFGRWLGPRQLDQVTPEHLAAYRDHLRDRGLKISTINRRLSSVRQLFQEAVFRKVLVGSSPAERLKSFKAPREGVTPALAAEDARHLLDSIPLDTLKGRRDHLLIHLGIRTSLRRAELGSLTISSISEDQGHHVIWATTKGAQEHRVKLPVDLKRELDQYLKLLPYREDPDGPLFPRMRKGLAGDVTTLIPPGLPISDHGIWEMVSQRMAAAGLGPLGPHTLRATFATLALRGGAKLQRVQYAMGHADPRTTERYDRSKDDLDDAAGDYIKL